ncbi:MAG: M67 family metallopeptidase [Desulfovibrio sp.]|jgi:proteasome lid subunit RPN8/RPN11|nr:M67 family metallopeptidase [Desulfovibrio sp.]
MIHLSPDAESGIRAEGEKAYPHECCGFLLGLTDEEGGRTVTEIQPVENSREEEARRRRFRIEPDDFMRVERQARAGNLEVVGFYHSHPDHPALPSEHDLADALPYYSYVIVAVSGGAVAALTSWELSVDRAQFNQEL